MTVTATDTTGASGSATFSWTISAAGGGCTAAQLLGNPGFETGTAAPWTAASGVISDSTKEPPHSGKWDAWLDGYGKTTTDTLSQAVTVPSGCSTLPAELLAAHRHRRDHQDHRLRHPDRCRCSTAPARCSGTLATFSNLNAASGYVQHTYNLSAYAGQNGHAEVHRQRGQRAADLVRHRRHRPQRQLTTGRRSGAGSLSPPR